MNKMFVDVEELLERVRAEAKRRARAGITTEIESGAESLPFPPTPPQTGQPTLHTSDLEIAKTAQKLDHLLGRATGANSVRKWLPKPLRGIWRDQGRVNETVVAALQALAKSEVRGLRAAQQVAAYLDAQWHWSRDRAERDELLYSWLSAIPAALNEAHRKVVSMQRDLEDSGREAEALRSDIQRSLANTEQVRSEVERTTKSVAQIESRFEEWRKTVAGAQETIVSRLDRSDVAGKEAAEALARLLEQLAQGQDRETANAAEVRNLQDKFTKLQSALNDSIAAGTELRRDFQTLNASHGATEAHIRGMQGWLEKLQQDLSDPTNGNALKDVLEKTRQLEEHLGEIDSVKQSIEAISNRTETIDERLVADGAFLKAQAAVQQRLLDSLVSVRTRNGAATPRSRKEDPAAKTLDHSHDAFYLAFENRFRGTRAQITERMKVYLRFLKGPGWNKKQARIVDLGCGRGEWLEVLGHSGYAKAEGVDVNLAMIQQCRERKLDVTEADALSFLSGTKTGSRNAITAYHLIEHLEFSVLLTLMSEAQRVLKQQGLLILETPNPRNILVGSSDFYRDMTHRNPIHPDTIGFALETLGFTQVQIYFLSDKGGERQAVPQEEFRFDDLAAYVEVPRDYAVIARKA